MGHSLIDLIIKEHMHTCRSANIRPPIRIVRASSYCAALQYRLSLREHHGKFNVVFKSLEISLLQRHSHMCEGLRNHIAFNSV